MLSTWRHAINEVHGQVMQHANCDSCSGRTSHAYGKQVPASGGDRVCQYASARRSPQLNGCACLGDVQVIGEVRGGLEGWFAKGRWAELGITEQVDSGKYKLTY